MAASARQCGHADWVRQGGTRSCRASQAECGLSGGQLLAGQGPKQAGVPAGRRRSGQRKEQRPPKSGGDGSNPYRLLVRSACSVSRISSNHLCQGRPIGRLLVTARCTRAPQPLHCRAAAVHGSLTSCTSRPLPAAATLWSLPQGCPSHSLAGFRRGRLIAPLLSTPSPLHPELGHRHLQALARCLQADASDRSPAAGGMRTPAPSAMQGTGITRLCTN